MKKSLIIALLFLLAGCADGPLQQSKIKDDQFSAFATIVGGQQSVNPFGGIFRSWKIRSFIDKKNGSVSHQIYVDISYLGNWQYFNSASDDTAKSLDVRKIDSQVGSCSSMCNLEEVIGIDIDDATLITHKDTGYNIKINARSGASLIITISAEQINLQLAAINNYKTEHNIKHQ
jgi:hypothetical protein